MALSLRHCPRRALYHARGCRNTFSWDDTILPSSAKFKDSSLPRKTDGTFEAYDHVWSRVQAQQRRRVATFFHRGQHAQINSVDVSGIIKFNDKNGEKKMPNGSRGSVAWRIVTPKMLRESRQSSIYVCTSSASFQEVVLRRMIHRTYLEK